MKRSLSCPFGSGRLLPCSALICLLTIVLHALNIYFSSKDNKTGILVIAIVDFVFGSFILAILNFLDYLDIGKQKRVEELEVENLE